MVEHSNVSYLPLQAGSFFKSNCQLDTDTATFQDQKINVENENFTLSGALIAAGGPCSYML